MTESANLGVDQAENLHNESPVAAAVEALEEQPTER